MAKSRRNRSRGSRSRRSRGSRSRRSRNSRSRRSRGSRSKRRQRGGFAAILKEAVVPIAFLSGNIKLKKGTFGNKKVMVPVFKNMNPANLHNILHTTYYVMLYMICTFSLLSLFTL